MSNRKQNYRQRSAAAIYGYNEIQQRTLKLSTVPPRLPLDLFQISETSAKNESITINADSSVASTSSAFEINLTLLSVSNNEISETVLRTKSQRASLELTPFVLNVFLKPADGFHI